MAHTSIRTTGLCAALVLATLAAIACSSATNPTATATNTPLSTPRSVPEHTTLENAITLLKDAGVAVAEIEDTSLSEGLLRQYDALAVERISVNGYASVWVFEYAESPGADRTASRFHVYADFSTESYPTLFLLNNIVYMVQGVDQDAIDAVLMALWDTEPATTLAPFGVPERWAVLAHEAEQQAGEWISDNYAERYVSIADPVFTRLGNAAQALPLEPVVERLPHPDSLVWVLQFIGYEDLKTIVVDYMTGLPVAVVNDSQRLDAVLLEQAPLPVIDYVNAVDGAQGGYDELHVVVEWRLAEPVKYAPDIFIEDDDSYVIERSPSGAADWEPIAWVTSEARNAAATDPPYTFVPPGGRAIMERPEYGPPLLRYWDYGVEPGVQYDYRVYGCTNLGRQTAYSETVSATGGDPDPSTQDPGAHISFAVEPHCSRETD